MKRFLSAASIFVLLIMASISWCAQDFKGSLSGNATTATTSTNITGGGAGSVPYQTGAGATTMLGLGAANTTVFVNAGGTAPEWAAGIKIGTFTMDISATTDVAVTGVGFKPSHIIFLAGIDGVPGDASIGFDNGTVSYRIGPKSTFAGGWNAPGTGSSIGLTPNSGADEAYCHIGSWDADGFTLHRNKAGSPTGTANVNYMAFR